MTKKASNRVDMIGKTYNSWKVLEHSHTKGKIAYYKCECLECNNEYVVDGRNVRSGRSLRCLDCGKKHTAKNQTGIKKSGRTSKEIAESYLLYGKRKSAFKRNKTWELTQEHFNKLVYSNCTYCGVSPMTTVNPTRGHNLQASRLEECFITYNGIDRKDSSKGYTLDNVVTCCEQCNRAKLDYTEAEFLAWIERVYNHQKHTAS